jgi:hypothetical protein
MAEPHDHALHPVLGELRWDEEGSAWTGSFALAEGRVVELSICSDGGDRRGSLEPAAGLFTWALENQSRLLDIALRAELLVLYNDTWRAQDAPPLTAEELAGRLQWGLLELSDSDPVPVRFVYQAGSLFGHRAVVVEVDTEGQYHDIDLWG